ncbi:FMN-binding negative transcriptional regulator [Psychrobacter sp. GP33]|uniref:FMN-binding negative transcriptional regulator n=1 Tax=Psychrobacter sp. GP33 TaxID=2758709 RepID=UPI0015F9627B|nr:FMN-binding negative transcriptional regulator [Psychrobacter sp. GP33]
MHIPKQFKQENDTELLELMREYPFATLITHSTSGMEANHLPISLSWQEDKLYLHAHIAKVNCLWQSVAKSSEVLVVFNGPNCYISPNHYPTKQQTGKAVPTWNYVAVHVKGSISFINDAAWIYQALENLTDEHEFGLDNPWAISDAPAPYIDKMLPAIVGIEIAVTSITGQWKLSQNQPLVNQVGVIDGLSASTKQNDKTVADMVQAQLQA